MSDFRELIPASFGWWLGGGVLVFWFVGAHNRLVRLRSAALVAYGALDAALGRQVDYVRSRATGATPAPASEEKGNEAGKEDGNGNRTEAQPNPAKPASSYSDAANSLLAAAAQTMAMLASARHKPLEPAGIEALGTALSVLLTAWERLFPGEAVSFDGEGTLSRPVPLLPQAGPVEQGAASVGGFGPSGTPVLPPLAWPEPSAAAEIARAQFNLAVAHYNRAIAQFPALFIAWVFRLHRAAPLL